MTTTAVTKGAATAASRARIIVAEDDFDMRRLVSDCLRKAGYEVHEVIDGSTLLRRVESSLMVRTTVDLVVTDVRMPGYDGLEIVSCLREAGVRVPVVIMTAFGNLETQQRAEQLGATLLDKPFKMEELKALVDRLLHEARPPSSGEDS
jgi:DNA-binding response OmpR family regulator